jgi:catechol 2,3-dioxygenase-like lactoylglutathione lyase family enzyme
VSTQPCKGIAQIERIALSTNDLESLCDFYRLLGGVASPLSTNPEDDLRACALDFCGIRLEVFERPHNRDEAAEEGTSPRLLHLGFALGSADAVDEISRVLAAAGHLLLEPPHRRGERGRYESVVHDPDGNTLKLSV